MGLFDSLGSMFDFRGIGGADASTSTPAPASNPAMGNYTGTPWSLINPSGGLGASPNNLFSELLGTFMNPSFSAAMASAMPGIGGQMGKTAFGAQSAQRQNDFFKQLLGKGGSISVDNKGTKLIIPNTNVNNSDADKLASESGIRGDMQRRADAQTGYRPNFPQAPLKMI